MNTTYYRVRYGYRIEPASDIGSGWWDIVEIATEARVGSLRTGHLYIVADPSDDIGCRSDTRLTVYGTGPDSEWVISDDGEAVTLGDLQRGVTP